MLNNYICVLDIGASKIAACLALIKKGSIVNIFFETTPSKGIKRGAITNSIDIIDCIGRALKNLKAASGINIKLIHTNISGQDMLTKHSRAIIPLAERGNKVIMPPDIKKVIEQARLLGSSLEEEIIHAIPLSYVVDTKTDILNPIGLYGHRLEVDLYLVCAKLSSIETLNRAINQAGYELKDLCFCGIASSQAIFNKELKEGITLLCDIGSDITELLLFKDGLLREIKVLPMGGNDITLELSEALKIPFDLADEVKRSYANVGDYSRIKEDKEILLKKNTVYKPIKQRLVCEIATLKTKLLCSNLKGAIEKIMPSSKINNFVASGRAIMLEGFLETLENTLGMRVKVGRIVNPKIISWVVKEKALSGQNYLTYVNCLGMICQVLEEKQSKIFSTVPSSLNPFVRALNRVKEVYQEYF